jgi:hypothetical protein
MASPSRAQVKQAKKMKERATKNDDHDNVPFLLIWWTSDKG